MKPAFFLLAFACLFCGLAASSFDLEDKTSIKNFEEFFHPKSSIDQAKIITLPPIYLSSTRRPRPISTTLSWETTTSPEPETTWKPTATTTFAPQTKTTETPTETTETPTETTETPTKTTETPTKTTETPTKTTETPTKTTETLTTTTRRPTTTGKPFPSTTTPVTRPAPNPYPPGFVKPQIYKNLVDIQGPLAGRLYNFVQNYQGGQDTKQTNEIMYNLRFAKAVQRGLDGSNHE